MLPAPPPASTDKTIRVWDALTRKERYVLEGTPGTVQSLAYHPRGRRLVSIGQDRLIRIWDVVTQQQILDFEEHVGNLRHVAFSADGRSLAGAGPGVVRVKWLQARGREMIWQKIVVPLACGLAHSIALAFHRALQTTSDGREVLCVRFRQYCSCPSTPNPAKLCTVLPAPSSLTNHTVFAALGGKSNVRSHQRANKVRSCKRYSRP